MAQKLKFGNGTWANKEGSTLAYNDEGNNYKPLPFSFSRDSIATRVNKEGLIEVVGNNKPRIDYTDSADGVLLLENSATNSITYSEDFSDSSWNVFRGSVTSNVAISPDGTLNASRYQEDSQTGSHLFRKQNLSIINGLSYTGSIFAKKGELTSVILQSNSSSRWLASAPFDLENGVVISGTGVIEDYGNGWYRCSISGNAVQTTPDAGLEIYTSVGIGRDGDGLFMYGAMFEQNSIASSYIPTSGSTVQRAAETANGSGNSEVFNDSEGVLFADIANSLSSGGDGYLSLSSDDGTQNNRVTIRFTATTNNLACQYVIGGVNQTSMDNILADRTVLNKIAFKYSLNDFSVWVNGFKLSTDPSGSVLPNGTLKKIGFNNGVSAPLYGKTKELGYYDTTLTDAELETLTSYRSLSELVTELNLNTL